MVWFRRQPDGLRRGQGLSELRPRGDAQLREHAVQVGGDGAVRQIEPLTDLAVRQSLGDQLCDLKLLGRQLVRDVARIERPLQVIEPDASTTPRR
jgi:hypothetical protein